MNYLYQNVARMFSCQSAWTYRDITDDNLRSLDSLPHHAIVEIVKSIESADYVQRLYDNFVRLHLNGLSFLGPCVEAWRGVPFKDIWSLELPRNLDEWEKARFFIIAPFLHEVRIRTDKFYVEDLPPGMNLVGEACLNSVTSTNSFFPKYLDRYKSLHLSRSVTCDELKAILASPSLESLFVGVLSEWTDEMYLLVSKTLVSGSSKLKKI